MNKKNKKIEIEIIVCAYCGGCYPAYIDECDCRRGPNPRTTSTETAVRTDLDAAQALLAEALRIWHDHGQDIRDETLPIYLVAHLAGNGYVIIQYDGPGAGGSMGS